MEIMDADAKPVQRIEYLVQQLASLQEEYASIENEPASLKALDPAIWSNLPGEMLQMVCARLPVPQIIRLQCLSKEFSEFRFKQFCASIEPNPKVFALIAGSEVECGVLRIELFDIISNRWHTFDVRTKGENYHDTMLASDGGLVCFILADEVEVGDPLVILVLNPLTREWKLLPPHSSLSKIKPIMLQLVMNRDTKCYKVFVIYEKQSPSEGESVLGMVYNSAIGEWSSTNSMSDFIFGYRRMPWSYYIQFELVDLKEWLPSFPCVYNCSETQLLDAKEQFQIQLESRIDCAYALVNDHLYVLQEEVEDPRFILLEYQWQKSKPYWVKIKVHRCDFTRPPPNETLYMRLQACKGFLMVSSYKYYPGTDEGIPWLYDLSTCKWQALPALEADENKEICDMETMCELQWDAVP